MSSDQQSVTWSYKPHATRWVVVVASFLSAISVSRDILPGTLKSSDIAQTITGALFFCFWLVIALIGSRPTIDASVVRRGTHVEMDLGRRAFDLFGAFAEFFQCVRSGALLRDINGTNRAILRRFLPTRHRHNIPENQIVRVTVGTSAIGPKLDIQIESGSTVTIDDVATNDLAAIRTKLLGLIESCHFPRSDA